MTTDPTQADLHRLADLLTEYAQNIQEVAYALRANRLGDLAHTLSAGKAIPAEQWGRLLGQELQQGLTPILLLCGKLWGVESLLKQERDHQARRVDAHRLAWTRAEERREQERRAEQARSIVQPLSAEPPDLVALPSPLQYDRETARYD